MPHFHTLAIKEIVKETDTAVSILFNIPEDLKKFYAFTAGQYVTVRTTIDGEVLKRAYSICSSEKSGELKIAVKAIVNGKFSNYACKHLSASDTVEVAPPEGHFILNTNSNQLKNYLAFVAGSGITPVLSMVKTVLENEPKSTFTLIYGNKTSESTIFKSELDALANKFIARFNIKYAFTQEKNTGTISGRIDKKATRYIVREKFNHLNFDEVFICGPEEMINVVSNTLTEDGFLKKNINYELFVSSSDTKDVSSADGISEITVLVDDEETTFTMDQKDTILAATLRHNIDAPYSCQGGVCSSCMGKVTEGHAIMSSNSILTDSEIEEGLVLTCQAHPTTAKIAIDFDDI
ncbi:ferredoxin--NADP reductase [Flavicella sp.]|uniref:ferredoxin--NADP reductase n=1 Tax=Flavicella sp. TaxID=2957742 RepID=UPI00301809AB